MLLVELTQTNKTYANDVGHVGNQLMHWKLNKPNRQNTAIDVEESL